MDYQSILVEKVDGLATITVNRPDQMNAISLDVIRELWNALNGLEVDRECGVIILTGAGDRVFVAGADMAGLPGLSPLQAIHRARQGQALTNKIESCRKPVIAAVNGIAFGAGLEICLACDLVVAAENAQFSLPEARLGFMPFWGGSQRLPRQIGKRRAKELILTGDIIDAARALEVGLVNSVVPHGQLVQEARALAGRILRCGRVAVQQAKAAIDGGMEMPLPQGLELEATCLGVCFSTEEPSRGIEEFLKED